MVLPAAIATEIWQLFSTPMVVSKCIAEDVYFLATLFAVDLSLSAQDPLKSRIYLTMTNHKVRVTSMCLVSNLIFSGLAILYWGLSHVSVRYVRSENSVHYSGVRTRAETSKYPYK
jgi:hypothetical protein